MLVEEARMPSSIERLEPGVLNREQIARLISDPERPLISAYLDLEAQLQPNGFDLTLREVSIFRGSGALGEHADDRRLPDTRPMAPDEDGWLLLPTGAYQVLFNEIVDLPSWLMALGRPRSSLGRSGVSIHTAVWDAGYRGRSTSLLTVHNPEGFRLQRNARVMQLVFCGLAAPTGEGYSGRYLDENVKGGR
jgi:dUTP pyrophosphatase